MSGIIVIASPYLVYLVLSKWAIFSDVWKKASKQSIKESSEYQDKALLKKVWASPAGERFFSAVEYQLMEGYCGPTSQRCVLKSIPSIPMENVPEAKRGPATAAEFTAKVDEYAKGRTKSRVVLGSEGYEAFLSTIKKANDKDYRVSINFLRSPLFGISAPWFAPFNLLLAFFGGHFSPIVAYLEQENLVAVFDVNHAYGLFLVRPERLFEATATYDVMSSKSRGLVLTQIIKKYQ